jgi:chemotaxis protein CheC
VILSKTQKDALSEIINMGFGRAANALSILVKKRVVLQTPEANVFPISQLGQAFSVFEGRRISTVHQAFQGGITGDMALLIESESATGLIDMVRQDMVVKRQLNNSDQEDLLEIGNILLNAFCGSFGNFLSLSVTFSIPTLYQVTVDELMQTLLGNNKEIQYAVVVKVHFNLAQGSVEGYVVILMGLSSLEELFRSMTEQGFMPEPSEGA